MEESVLKFTYLKDSGRSYQSRACVRDEKRMH